MADVKENKPKPTHLGNLKRAHYRTLFIKANAAREGTRSEARWLAAIVAETEDIADLEIKTGAILSGKMLEKPDEIISREFSDDAVKGAKVALVQAIIGNPQGGVPRAAVADKRDLLDIAGAFGEKFRKLVEKESLPPESDNLDDDAPLDLA